MQRFTNFEKHLTDETDPGCAEENIGSKFDIFF